MKPGSNSPENNTKRVIDKVGLCVLDEGRLLVGRSQGDTVFQIPGGKVEASDDDDLSALEREISEELGVAIDPTTAQMIGVFSAPAAGKPGVEVMVKLYMAEFSGAPSPCSEIEELSWLAIADDSGAEVSAVLRDQILPFLRNQPAQP